MKHLKVNYFEVFLYYKIVSVKESKLSGLLDVKYLNNDGITLETFAKSNQIVNL